METTTDGVGRHTDGVGRTLEGRVGVLSGGRGTGGPRGSVCLTVARGCSSKTATFMDFFATVDSVS